MATSLMTKLVTRMNNNWRLSVPCGVLSVICMTGTAYAKSTDLDNLYRLALNNDPLLRIAEFSTDQSEYAVRGESGKLLPQISAYFNLAGLYQSDVIESAFGGNGSTSNVGLTLSQAIYTPAVRAGIAVAESGQISTQLLLTKAHETLIYRTTQNYFDVLRTKALLDAAKANLDALESYHKMVVHRTNAGISSEIDLVEAEARLDQANVTLLEMEVQYQLALDTLETLSGESFSSVKGFDLDGFDPALPQVHSGESWLDVALKQNRDVLLAQQAVEKSKLDLKRAQSGHKPQLYLQARLNQRLHGQAKLASGANIANDENLTSAEVSLNLSVPVYTGSTLSAYVDIAQSDVEISYQILEESQLKTQNQVRSAHRQMVAKYKQIAAFQKSVESQQKALISVKKGYELGARNMNEVLDSTRDLFISTSNMYNAYFAFIENAMLVKYLSGEISEQDIASLNANITKG